MKVIFVTLLALAASAFASPVVSERQLDSQATEIDSLMAKIQGHTASISKIPVLLLSPPWTRHI